MNTFNIMDICGRDEDGEVKATCNLQVLAVNPETNEYEVCAEACSFYGEVSMCVENEMVTVDIKFRDSFDDEYLQMSGIFSQYFECREKNKSAELMLTLMNTGVYSDFILCSNFAWCFTSSSPVGTNDTIRFWMPHDDIKYYQIPDEAASEMLNNIGDELTVEEFMN